MSDRSVRPRLLIMIALLLAATVLMRAANRRERIPLRQPLQAVPIVLGQWHGAEVPLTQRIINVTGMDDYLNRFYIDGDGNQIEIYVGYYKSQRAGDLIHSPRNCLPGAGWETLRASRSTIQIPGHSPIIVNDFLMVKGLQRDLVLYWYQGRGRAIASEYTAKFWMITDALTRNRTDAALVRIVVPITNTESESRAQGIAFVQTVYPHLSEFIPN